MKKVIVFGASGGTGKLVVEQSLRAGSHVTVVVRNPDTFEVRYNNLKIIKGDIFEPATFENALKGKDAVVSCLGIPEAVPTTVYSNGVLNITTAMVKAGVNRIICISSSAVIIPPESSFVMKFLLKSIIQRLHKPVHSDMLLMEKVLRESDLNWTIIRAPKLTNGKHTGKYKITTNQPFHNIPTISRADLADYIVKHLTDEETFKKTIEVLY
jgi:putative NADH-flavin reductase